MLTQEEFSDIHNAVLEAMGFVALPVTLYRVSPAQEFDPLYQEAKDGEEAMVPWATVHASMRFKPDEEFLTKAGLRTNADILAFIPRGHILAWEAESGQVFKLEQGMELEFGGIRYSVDREPRTDPLPMLMPGGAVSQDYIGMVVMGTVKADTHPLAEG